MRHLTILAITIATIACAPNLDGESTHHLASNAKNRLDDAGVGSTSDGGYPEPAPVGTGATDGKPGVGGLPAKIVGLYFFMYDTPRLAEIQANAPEYNVIYFAFAVGSNGGGGNVTFSLPSGGGEATFKNDVEAWHRSGRTALLSIGGGTDTGLRLQTAEQGKQFVDSISPIVESYGFDGIDWDLEQADAYDVAVVADVSRRLKQTYGPSFTISIAPRPFEFRSGATHPYRDLASALGDDLDIIGLQFYDYLEAKDAAQQSGIIARDIADATKDFPASKLLIGAESPNAGTAWSPAPVYRDAYMANDKATGGLRGVFVWSSPHESKSGWSFAKTVGPAVIEP